MEKSDRQRATARSRAEIEFLATQKNDKNTLEEDARNEKSRHVAELKAKRLAKEAEDREQAASKPARKPTRQNKPSANLPQFHRF